MTRRLMLTAAFVLTLLAGVFLAYVVQWSRDAIGEWRKRRELRKIIKDHRPRFKLSRQMRRAEARRISKQAANWIGGGNVEGAP